MELVKPFSILWRSAPTEAMTAEEDCWKPRGNKVSERCHLKLLHYLPNIRKLAIWCKRLASQQEGHLNSRWTLVDMTQLTWKGRTGLLISEACSTALISSTRSSSFSNRNGPVPLTLTFTHSHIYAHTIVHSLAPSWLSLYLPLVHLQIPSLMHDMSQASSRHQSYGHGHDWQCASHNMEAEVQHAHNVQLSRNQSTAC